jgi:hypothetical protein
MANIDTALGAMSIRQSGSQGAVTVRCSFSNSTRFRGLGSDAHLDRARRIATKSFRSQGTILGVILPAAFDSISITLPPNHAGQGATPVGAPHNFKRLAAGEAAGSDPEDASVFNTIAGGQREQRGTLDVGWSGRRVRPEREA